MNFSLTLTKPAVPKSTAVCMILKIKTVFLNLPLAITFLMFISMVSALFRAMLSGAVYNFQAVAIKRGEAKRAVVTPIV